jgi:signal transduction histidine kinase
VENYFSDCVSELKFDLELKNIELNYMNYTDKDLEIVADAEQLKRVINNIIGNSVKYMEKKKGIISIRLRKTGVPQKKPRVLVEIEDNGSGVSETELENIFERFYRTDASRNSAKGGSGLGLAIVKKIIEDHGGTVYATGKEGVGTCICFTLEIARKEEQSVMPDKEEL